MGSEMCIRDSHALNFVLDKTLGGGVTRSLALDKHGKTLGMALLEMEV